MQANICYEFSSMRPWAKRRHGVNQAGVALVIILAFIALLTGLVVAFFSRSINEQQISNSSVNQNKVGIFADGAAEVTIGDLKQEIVAGSNPATIQDSVIYVPKAPMNATPARVGTADTLPNLVKTSTADPFFPGSTIPVRASSLDSTTPSLIGRYVPRKRWNSHFLLPKKTPDSATDATPIDDFKAPKWIMVTQNGPNPTTYNLASLASVAGRYAYAIYDEGGLLDLNVAGYPTPLTAEQAAHKPSTALANLKELPGIADLSAEKQKQLLDSFIGWRNYASASTDWTKNPVTTSASPLDGTLAGWNGTSTAAYKWDTGQSTNYYNFVLQNKTGYMRNGNLLVYNEQSDRPLISRQDMQKILFGAIAFKWSDSDRAKLQNALQYLTNFTRELNQPSYFPDPNRPKIVAGTGGNDGYSGDSQSDDSKNINPPFLKVRVTGAFNRNNPDPLASVTPAVVGEPLVKKRFPLNYLAWLTYEGPGAKASAATKDKLRAQGISSAIIEQGTAENITKYFGLTWTSAKSYSPFTATNASDPWVNNAQRDGPVDGAIMQIGANIVDQFDFDGYPTRISFNDSTFAQAQDFRGVEDLPYLYRVREGRVMIKDSTPPQQQLPMVTPTKAPPGFDPGEGSVLQEPEIWNPHAWSASVKDAAPRPTMFQLVAVSTLPSDTENTSLTNVQPGVQWRLWTPAGASALTRSADGLSAPAPVNAKLAFSIPMSRRDLFREPTLMIKPGVPAGSDLSGGTPFTSLHQAAQLATNNVTDDKNYLGIVLGRVPMAWLDTISPLGIGGTSPATLSNGIIPAGYVYYKTAVSGITYRLQYVDASGAYVTYDEKYAHVVNAASYDTVNSPPPNYNNQTFSRSNAVAFADNIIGKELSVLSFDPRTSCFGMIYAGQNGRGNRATGFPVTRDNSNSYAHGWAGGANGIGQMALQSSRPDEYQGFMLSTWGGMTNGFGRNSGPTAVGWGAGGGVGNASDGPGTIAVLRPGLYSQNSIEAGSATASTLRYAGDPESSTAPANPTQVYADPDGVVRRAMAGYVPAGNGVPAASGTGLPMKTATTYDGNGVGAPTSDMANRPIILNRPFRSVIELSQVFSGAPWRNLSMSTPESGSVALLDVFSINDTDNLNNLVAGKVNLNTRQAPVLKAMLSGAYKDEWTASAGAINSAEADALSQALVKRTMSAAADQGPMANIGELVGRWNKSVSGAGFVDGAKSYTGFAADDLTSTLTTDQDKRIQRFREASLRVLAAGGQTRV